MRIRAVSDRSGGDTGFLLPIGIDHLCMESAVSKFLAERIRAGEFPSASYLVAARGNILESGALGNALLSPESRPADENTIYDLASLTKPLVSALLCAKLTEAGSIAPDDRVSRFIPELDTDRKRGITIGHLISHTSGFEAWVPFYLLANGANRRERLRSLIACVAKRELFCETGTNVVYSDVNYIILGSILESVYGERLDVTASKEIFAPLRLKNTFFNPDPSFLPVIAGSEKGNRYERNMAAEMGFDPGGHAWRDLDIHGEVHDENCRFLGGIAGHAGLFSRALDIFETAKQFLAESTVLLRPATCSLFHTDLTGGSTDPRSYGFRLAGASGAPEHSLLPAESFGHVGFTGTGLWIDPAEDRIYILLTNRTHGRHPPFAALKGTRRGFLRLASVL